MTLFEFVKALEENKAYPTQSKAINGLVCTAFREVPKYYIESIDTDQWGDRESDELSEEQYTELKALFNLVADKIVEMLPKSYYRLPDLEVCMGYKVSECAAGGTMDIIEALKEAKIGIDELKKDSRVFDILKPYLKLVKHKITIEDYTL